jgi:small subunit ribosomal protein S6
MNHYETVFILNPVLSDVQVKETVSKFEDFLTTRGATMVSKEDWGLKKWLTKFKTKKVVSITYLNSMFRRSFNCF